MTPAASEDRSRGLPVRVGRTRLTCRPSGAAWIGDAGVLVVADLHLEKGSAFATRGQLLPPYDTTETLGRLEAEIAALDPAIVVLLGDSFHDSGAGGRLDHADGARLVALALGRRLVWILGNHDRALSSPLPGESAPWIELGGLRLVHEPAEGVIRGEMAGHLHPCARVRGAAGSVRRRCFVTDGERMILPAFGAYAGGLNLLDRAFARRFCRPPAAVVLGAERAHLVGWRSLGPD